jgi:hypothetical protein
MTPSERYDCFTSAKFLGDAINSLYNTLARMPMKESTQPYKDIKKAVALITEAQDYIRKFVD